MPWIEILRIGPLATVQDRGRPGWAHLGVPVSGAADMDSAAVANRLVGNSPDAAVLEVTLGGLVIRARGALVVGVCGAPVALTVNGSHVAMDAPVVVPNGGTLHVGMPTAGLRSYLAVRGGLAVPPVLGSRSTDVVNGIGPAPLSEGDRLPIGTDTLGEPASALPLRPRTHARETTVRVLLGPRADWFTDPGRLCSTAWQVTDQLDRIGIRLDGPALSRRRTQELPSEGIVPGAVQVPTRGRPLVFLRDHPTTGGYPVLAVTVTADLDLLGQVRPGDLMRFQRVGSLK